MQYGVWRHKHPGKKSATTNKLIILSQFLNNTVLQTNNLKWLKVTVKKYI